MNSDLVLGYAQAVSGRMVEMTGWLLSQPRLEANGRTQRAYGDIRSTLGQAKIALKSRTTSGQAAR